MANLQGEGLARVKHLKVLGKGGNSASLADARCLQYLVEDLVETVGMQLLGDPQVHEVEVDIRKLGREPFEDEGGVSVLACLSTSHVALHTWPLRGEFHLDIYSCREFEAGPVLGMLLDTLQESAPAGDALGSPPATGLGPSPASLHLEVHDLTFACDFARAEPCLPCMAPPPQLVGARATS